MNPIGRTVVCTVLFLFALGTALAQQLFGAAAYAAAAARGNCSGCSTANRFASASEMTVAAGGASAAGFA